MQLSPKTKMLNALRTPFKWRWLENILCRITRGKTPHSFWARLIPNHYQYPVNTIREAKRNGINFHFDLSDSVDWYVYFGLKDTAHAELYDLCKPGDVVLDIGTNIGSVLMNLAQKTGNTGHVYGFEPDPVNYRRCLRNISLNHFTNITIENTGLGSAHQQLHLTVHNAGNRGMNRVSALPTATSTVVNIIPLDHYIAQHDIQKIDLVKMDVEGFEYSVLLGAEKTLKKFKPNLFIELDNDNLLEQGASARQLVNYLLDMGYFIQVAGKNAPVTHTTNLSHCHFDIICIFQKRAVDL